MTGVVDYGVGNLFSLASSLDAIGERYVISSDKNTLGACERLILPGVGAFGAAMEKLKEKRLVKFIKDFVNGGGKLLGICLGMQLLFEKSYEFGEYEGLGLIRGEVVSLERALKEKNVSLKVPAIGWNELVLRKEHPIAENLKMHDFVYYVHSFFVPVGEYTVAFSDYGVPVTGIAACGNAAGCQFHPEKSGETGLAILRAFCKGDKK